MSPRIGLMHIAFTNHKTTFDTDFVERSRHLLTVSDQKVAMSPHDVLAISQYQTMRYYIRMPSNVFGAGSDAVKHSACDPEYTS